MRSLVPLLLLLINAAAFLIMCLDKRRAVQGRWRIPEATLLLFAAWWLLSACALVSLSEKGTSRRQQQRPQKRT